MKILIIGIDGLSLERIVADERLDNFRRFMDVGVFGKLQSVVPATPIPAWLSMMASQDPGSLGVYGGEQRVDRSYEFRPASHEGLTRHELDRFLGEGTKSIVIDVRPENSDSASEQWQAALRNATDNEWNAFRLIDSHLDRLHHCVEEESAESAIEEHYLFLDQQVGKILEAVDEQTILAVISTHSLQRVDRTFFINRWLIEEGFLALKDSPTHLRRFDSNSVDWERTRAWSTGGFYAPIFLNVKGREPQGAVKPTDMPALLDEVAARLAKIPSGSNRPLELQLLRPAEIYRETRGIAPDLLIRIDARITTSSAGEGDRVMAGVTDHYADIPRGAFLLAAPNSPLNGAYEGADLLDMAPTLLDLAGVEIPTRMQGRSLVRGLDRPNRRSDESEAERLIRDRLAGLGYV